jgi:CHAT domain-containing protein/tetratricopeptide (TPR) repeat protein
VDYPFLSTVGAHIATDEFSLSLQLLEGPPTTLNAGLSDWKQMYQMALECGDLRGVARAIQSLFSVAASTGQALEALLCARRLFTIANEMSDPLIVGHALADIAWANWVVGDHVSAEQAARETLKFAGTLNPKPLIHPFAGPEAIKNSATDLLLNLKQARGDLRRSLSDHNAMLLVHKERGDVLQAISSMEGIALVHKDLGSPEEALKWFSLALQELDRAEVPDPRAMLLTRAGLLGNIGVVLTHIGDTEEALRRIDEASHIYGQLSDNFGLIATHGQEGRALLRAGRVRESLVSLRAMLQLAQRFDSESWQQAAHFNLSRAYLASANRSDAITHCEHAFTLAREKLGKVGVDLFWLRAAMFHPLTEANTRAAAETDTKRFIALTYYAVQALHREVRGSRPMTVVERWIDDFEAVIESALLLPGMEPLSIAPMQHLNEESSLLRTSLASLDSLAQKSPFVGWLPLDIGLYCLESFRAQEFQEQLLLNVATLEFTHDPQLAAELARVEAELEKLQSAPPIVITGTASFNERREFVMPATEPNESIERQQHDQDEHRKRVAALSARRDALALQTIRVGETAEIALQVPVRLSDIRDVLVEDEMFVEFVLLGQRAGAKRTGGEVVLLPSNGRPDSAFAIVLTRSVMDVIPLGATAVIERQVYRLLDMIERFGSELSLPVFQVEARVAFDLLLLPIWTKAGAEMHSVRHLVVAADGVLNLLPLDILLERSVETCSWCDLRYLGRRFSTEYTPSATVFVDLRLGRYRRGSPGQTFVAFGDPAYRGQNQSDGGWQGLPGTRREIEAITTLVRSAKINRATDPLRLFTHYDAKREYLLDAQLLHEAEYIHLACHGSARRLPGGGIFLADVENGAADRGLVTGYDVMGLRTNAKLVVMSACESGLGKQARGEGIQGLVRAWLFAGAQSVIASLWEVDDDATAELMKFFYKGVLEGSTSTSDALATAKRHAMAEKSLACPVFWGAFSVFASRSADSSQARALSSILERFGAVEDRVQQNVAGAVITPYQAGLLQASGSSWEAAWRSGNEREFYAFFDCSSKLASSLGSSISSKYGFATGVALRLAAKNCRIAWEHWTKEHRAPLSVRAYMAHISWYPSERSDAWDAVASAYRPENLKRVRELGKRNLLARDFEMRIDEAARASLTTRVSYHDKSLAAGPEDMRPLEIALPMDESEFSSTAAVFTHCVDLRWLVFPIRPGESFSFTEDATSAIHRLEDETYLIGSTWGSSLFPHYLTIRFHPAFVPLRLQRQQIGRAPSIATVQFSPEGASVKFRPAGKPWVERLALLFRRAPGASAMLGAADSPFLEELEFSKFEGILQAAWGLTTE